MPRALPLALAQLPPRLAADPLSGFATEVEQLLRQAPGTLMAVFPELHLCGVSGPATESAVRLREAAEPLDGPRVRQLAEIAGDLGVWLLPGTVCEQGPDGELFNTALA